MKKILLILFIMMNLMVEPLSSQVIGPRLRFLSTNYKTDQGKLLKLPAKRKIRVTLQFNEQVDIVQLSHLLPDGIEIFKVEGLALHSAHVVVAEMDLDRLKEDELKSLPHLISAESLWRPHHLVPLNVSRPQIQADQLWQELDKQGRNLTGKGVLIADFDTGIDLMHPAFFFPDGDTLAWIDVNGNGSLDAGIDGVDKDGNGSIEGDELLNFIPTESHLSNPPGYTPSLDWLFNDMNGNGKRDYGAGLFLESDPAYGEPLYIVDDENNNDILDVGEKLVALKTCKVRKVYQSNGIVRTRGIDLIENEGDRWGHGTPVCGILAGGVAGVHQLAGIAPDAEILMGTNVYIDDPPFIQTMEILAPWAANEGANVMLYEDGEWIWQYMDGSSALETMMNDFAALGIIQVVPAGNLSGGGMHTSANVRSGEVLAVPLTVVNSRNQQKIWGNFLWTGDSTAFSFTLAAASGNAVTLKRNGRVQNVGDYQVYSYQSRSWRGTNRLDFLISAQNQALTGTFTFTLENSSNSMIDFHAYLWDDKSGWSGNTRWNDANDNGTITWPSTADSAISVAAYNPRDNVQSLNSFSGRGARVDGLTIMDIGAPGSTVYSTATHSRYGGYRGFGGTSAAGPHVAGAAALLLQYNPGISSGQVRSALHSGADQQNINDRFPNDSWGYGRLRIYDAFNQYLAPVALSPSTVPVDFHLSAAPNPFDEKVRIEFFMKEADHIEIVVFNILGQRVKKLFSDFRLVGNYSIHWNGKDEHGNGLAGGIYIISVRTGNVRISQKIILM